MRTKSCFVPAFIRIDLPTGCAGLPPSDCTERCGKCWKRLSGMGVPACGISLPRMEQKGGTSSDILCTERKASLVRTAAADVSGDCEVNAAPSIVLCVSEKACRKFPSNFLLDYAEPTSLDFSLFCLWNSIA